MLSTNQQYQEHSDASPAALSPSIDPGGPGWQLVAPADVLYRFVVPEYRTHWGENLRVVGSLPELGNWDVGSAPQMQWQEGHKWVLEVALPKVAFEFKVIVMASNHIRWEQGVNRVVETGLGADDTVELVINLTCKFDLTHVTGMDLVLDRDSVEESYELAKATLELLQKRRGRLAKAMEELRSLEAGPARGHNAEAQYLRERAEQESEAARLDAALASQATSVMDLSSLLVAARPGGPDAGDNALLVPLHGGKVDVPNELRRIARMQATQTDSLALALSPPGTLPPLPGTSNGVQRGNGTSPAGPAAEAYMTATAADVAAADSMAPPSFDMAAEAANADNSDYSRGGAAAGWAVRGMNEAAAARKGGHMLPSYTPFGGQHADIGGADTPADDAPALPLDPVTSELQDLGAAIQAQLGQLGESLAEWQQLGVLVHMAQARCDSVSIDFHPHEPAAEQTAASLEELQALIEVAEARLASFDAPRPARGIPGFGMMPGSGFGPGITTKTTDSSSAPVTEEEGSVARDVRGWADAQAQAEGVMDAQARLAALTAELRDARAQEELLSAAAAAAQADARARAEELMGVLGVPLPLTSAQEEEEQAREDAASWSDAQAQVHTEEVEGSSGNGVVAPIVRSRSQVEIAALEEALAAAQAEAAAQAAAVQRAQADADALHAALEDAKAEAAALAASRAAEEGLAVAQEARALAEAAARAQAEAEAAAAMAARIDAELRDDGTDDALHAAAEALEASALAAARLSGPGARSKSPADAEVPTSSEEVRAAVARLNQAAAEAKQMVEQVKAAAQEQAAVAVEKLQEVVPAVGVEGLAGLPLRAAPVAEEAQVVVEVAAAATAATVAAVIGSTVNAGTKTVPAAESAPAQAPPQPPAAADSASTPEPTKPMAATESVPAPAPTKPLAAAEYAPAPAPTKPPAVEPIRSKTASVPAWSAPKLAPPPKRPYVPAPPTTPTPTAVPVASAPSAASAPPTAPESARTPPTRAQAPASPASQLAATVVPAAATATAAPASAAAPSDDVAAVIKEAQAEAAVNMGKSPDALPGVLIEMAPSGPNFSDTELPVITFRFTDAAAAAKSFASMLLGRGQPAARSVQDAQAVGASSGAATAAPAPAAATDGAAASQGIGRSPRAPSPPIEAAAAHEAAAREAAITRAGSPLPDDVQVEVQGAGVITFRFK